MCRCASNAWASIPLRGPSFKFPFCFSFFTSFLCPLDTWQRKHGCFPFSAACLSPELLNDFSFFFLQLTAESSFHWARQVKVYVTSHTSARRNAQFKKAKAKGCRCRRGWTKLDTNELAAASQYQEVWMEDVPGITLIYYTDEWTKKSIRASLHCDYTAFQKRHQSLSFIKVKWGESFFIVLIRFFFSNSNYCTPTTKTDSQKLT